MAGKNTDNLPCLGSTFEILIPISNRIKIVIGIEIFQRNSDLEDLREKSKSFESDKPLKEEVSLSIGILSFPKSEVI